MTRLAHAAGVGFDERRTLVLVAAVFAALEAGRGLGEVGVNTLVLSRLPEDALPYLYIVLGAVSLVVAVVFGAALGRTRKARLFGATLGTVGAVLVVERALLATGSTAILPILWLTVTAAGTIAGTIGWTVATSTFDTRQAKRLFPICTAAAIAGYFVGSLLAGPIASLVGTESLVVLQAVLFVAAALVIARVARTGTGSGWAMPRGMRRPIIADVRIGFDEVRRSPLMRLVAVAYVLFAVLSFSVTYPFLLAAEVQFPAEADLAFALGTLSAAVTATSFIVSIVVANRFYARFGVAAAALVLPIVYLVGFGTWIVSFSFATAAVFVFVQQSTQRGLSNAAWSAMYNLVPAGRRAQVLAFQDGVPGQVGTALSGVLLLTAARLLAPDQVFWLGLATAAILTAVVIAIRRRYADSLLRNLRAGAGEQLLEGGPTLGDLVEAADVRATLIEALDAPERSTRAIAASLLARSSAPDARTALAGALDDDDPRVRGAAASSLLAIEAQGPEEAVRHPSCTSAEAVLDGLVRGGTAERVAGAQALERLGRPLPADVATAFLGDREPNVRAAGMATLGAADDPAATAALVHGLEDPAAVVRMAAADGLATRATVPWAVIAVLAGGSPDAQAASLRAMDGHRAEVAPVVLSWAESTIARAIALADAEHAIREGEPTANESVASTDGDTIAFLCDVLARRVERDQDLALGAMSVLGAPEARGVIRRSLRSDDADVRAQAIEALDSIGDRRLGSAVTKLVEHRPGRDHATRYEAIAQLRHDDDPWISGLARRAEDEGDRMPDASPSLEHLETMLVLRRVPLFERLEPEDLQRIAMATVEQSFGPHATIMREGEPSQELFVLLEGHVHVTRQEPDGSERRVRDYVAGDHIGELAVLRDRPRSATVVAASQGVRALVIDGEGLRAILRERPEAAMAMLATLAERISAQ
jgi:HEAT repeat protein